MDLYAQVKLKEDELKDLYGRMKEDRELYYMAKYAIRDKDGLKVPDIINVTLNKPRLYADKVISAINGTSQQTVVESQKHSFDTHKVEEFLEAAFNAADARLRDRGQASLNFFTDAQLCIRGRTARRVLFRLEDGKLIPDVVNWDSRFVTFERGEDDYKWTAYHIDRNWAATEEIYGELMVKYGVYKEGEKREKANICDIWTPDHNEIWIEGKQVLEQGHEYGFDPVIIEIVPLGLGNVLMEEDRLQHEGESIYSSIRLIIPEMNRLVSLLQTLNQRQLLAPQKFMNPDGTPQDTPPDFPQSMDVVSVGKGDLGPIDYGDARKSAEMIYAILEKSLQQGSITDVDMGNLNFPLSAVALVTIGEGKDQVYIPRLDTKARLNQKTSEMIIKQVMQIGGSVELGTKGHEQSFDTSKLDGDYTISYKYYTKSPKDEIARMKMANEALQMGIDRMTVYTDILQYEDPKGMEQRYYYDLAEKLSPNVLRNRTIVKLLELAERDGDEDAARDAQIMATEMGMSIQQIMMGTAPPPEPQVPAPGQSTLPLLAEGNKVGGIKPAPITMEAS